MLPAMVEKDTGPAVPTDGPSWSAHIERFNRDRLDEARVALAVSAPTGIGAGYVVDPGRMQTAINQLGEVIDRVERTLVHAGGLAFPEPGLDPVSRNSAANSEVLARRAEEFIRAFLAQLQQARATLQAELDAYRRTEDDNTVRL
ncbi:MAG TPA: PE domain-containing protein [Pseudonocardia sp.]|jgi:hypothetical protein|nr:PE domain-containing protein [Pseudonocardia sp.]